MDTELLQASFNTASSLLGECSPHAVLVLGSGWSDVVATFDVKRTVPYSDLPGLGATQVQGHSGNLILAEANGREILIFQGRRHYYEGEGWEPIAIPPYISARLGASVMVLTNAAGAISRDLVPGDLMIITDHINAMGSNPLIGKHDPFWGPRFPDQTSVYDVELQDLLMSAAGAVDISLSRGIYLATTGPTYETPAEIEMFSSMGTDAVGMSTVPEAILANATGMRVAGLSCITNSAAGVSDTPLAHEEVIAMTKECMPRMKALLTEFLALLTFSRD